MYLRSGNVKSETQESESELELALGIGITEQLFEETTLQSTMANNSRIELPQFDPDSPGGIGVWLKQVDVRLKIGGRTSEQDKYDFIVAALPTDIANRVYDLITNEPTVDPYTTLTNRIKEEFQPSEAERVKKLLRGLQRGSKKPSVFLREMRSLAGSHVGDGVLRELFLAQLPPSIADILTVMNSSDLQELAVGADKAWEREEQRSSVAAAALAPTPPCSENLPSSSGDLVNRLVERLEAAILSRNPQSNRRQHSTERRSRTPYRGRRDSTPHGSKQRSSSKPRNPAWKRCRDHWKYGENARRCTQWCELWGKPYQPPTTNSENP